MSDKKYREWVQRQPSCLSGQFSEYVNGEGRCIAAHVRRAGESGIAYKAEYSCVPLTDEEHRYQHQHGEAAAIMKFRKGGYSPEQARRMFNFFAKYYLRRWRREAI